MTAFEVPDDWAPTTTTTQQKSAESGKVSNGSDKSGRRGGDARHPPRARDSSCSYLGFVPSDAGDAHVDALDVPEADSVEYESFVRDFYHSYVKRRRPAVLRPRHASRSTSGRRIGDARVIDTVLGVRWNVEPFSLQSMREDARVANTVVRVEKRSAECDERHCFGKGVYTETTMGELVRSFEVGGPESSNLYLTTQKDAYDVDGRPALISKPLDSMFRLGADGGATFPLRPSILPYLVPSQINLWMGATASRTSSGLHHDFHDNLYTLMSGSKTFLLFPPPDARYLYPHGGDAHVMSNGLLRYGRAPTTDDEDGWDEEAMATVRERMNCRKRLMEASKVAEGEEGEDELDRAMDDILRNAARHHVVDDYDEECEGELDRDLEDDPMAGHAETIPRFPPSFSRIGSVLFGPGGEDDNTRWKSRWRDSQFPMAAKARMMRCEIEAGSSLYIPASWWHEVVSQGGGDANVHVALNYWFHPPDNLRTVPENAHEIRAYRRRRWDDDFDERQKLLDANGADGVGAGGAAAATSARPKRRTALESAHLHKGGERKKSRRRNL